MKELNAITASSVVQFPSRLLSAQEAAAYLGRKSTAFLRHIPVKPLSLGPGLAARYDKQALDRWLDELSGLTGTASRSANNDDAEAALENWRLRHGYRAA